jgi:diguanylate cyclase (GGDEF)-like protein
MRKFLTYTYFIGDPEHRRQFFSEVHQIVSLTQAFGLLAWLSSIALLLSANGSGCAVVLWGLPGILLCLLLTLRAASLTALVVSGVLGALSTAWAYRLFLDHSEQPQLWVLPLGITISLAAAPVFSSLVNYLATSCATWLILAAGHFPARPGEPDFNLAMVAVIGSLCIGAYLNVYFLTLRVNNYRAQKELTALAFKDSVTGLNNRRKFSLDARLAQTRTDNMPLHFLMIDIDDFKVINDTLGHDAGDDVLRLTAAVIDRLSTGHLCGRLGGEEFGVVFSGSASAAEAFASRLLQDVQAACQPPRTVSIGIAELCKISDLSVSYRDADQALYAAKRAGKNRYVTAAPRQALPAPASA